MLGEDYDVLMAVYRYKKRSGELGEITGDVGLRMAATNLEDGFRLTIWAYDRQEVYLSSVGFRGHLVPAVLLYCSISVAHSNNSK